MEQPKTIKHRVEFPSFLEAMKHDWRSLTKKQAKHQNAELVFSIFGPSLRYIQKNFGSTDCITFVLALWRYQSQHNALPSDEGAAYELASLATELITSARVKPQVLQNIPMQQLE